MRLSVHEENGALVIEQRSLWFVRAVGLFFIGMGLLVLSMLRRGWGVAPVVVPVGAVPIAAGVFFFRTIAANWRTRLLPGAEEVQVFRRGLFGWHRHRVERPRDVLAVGVTASQGLHDTPDFAHVQLFLADERRVELFEWSGTGDGAKKQEIAQQVADFLGVPRVTSRDWKAQLEQRTGDTA